MKVKVKMTHEKIPNSKDNNIIRDNTRSEGG